MAYEIINSREFYEIENGPITLLKYNILRNGDKFYLQLKLINTSNNVITRFSFRYLDGDTEQVYSSEIVNAEPGEEFFTKTLIPLSSKNFDFVTFEKIFGKKETTLEKKEATTTLERKENHKKREYYQDINYTNSKKLDVLLIIIWLLVVFLAVNIFLPSFMGIYIMNSPLLTFLIPFIAIMILLIVRDSRKNPFDEDKKNKKKDLTPSILWIITLYTISAAFLIYNVTTKGSTLATSMQFSIENHMNLVFALFFALAGSGVLLFYILKRRKFIKENRLIKRKHILLYNIPLIVLTFIQCLTLSTYNSFKTEIDGVIYRCAGHPFSSAVEVISTDKSEDGTLRIRPQIYYGYREYRLSHVSNKAFDGSNANTIIFEGPRSYYSLNYFDENLFSNCVSLENVVFMDAINMISIRFNSNDIFGNIEDLNIFLDFSKADLSYYEEKKGYKFEDSIFGHIKDSYNIYFAPEWKLIDDVPQIIHI